MVDIAGAQSVGLSKSHDTRAIDGELINPGLFKIDKDGNVSTVATYFTSDEDGDNGKYVDLKISVVPKFIKKVTKNFLVMVECSYIDEEGKGQWYLNNNYGYLLVRITDGKIFCYDNIIGYVGEYSPTFNTIGGEFDEGDDGTLYCNYKGYIGKITFTNGEARYEQINASEPGGSHLISINNNITYTFDGFQSGILHFQNGSFKKLSGGYKSSPSSVGYYYGGKPYEDFYIPLKNNLGYIVKHESGNVRWSTFHYVSIGSNSEEIGIEENAFAQINDVSLSLFGYDTYPILDTERYLFIKAESNHLTDFTDKYCLTAINKNSKEWKTLCTPHDYTRLINEPGNPLSYFSPFVFSKQYNFNNKYWGIASYSDNSKTEFRNYFLWFDPIKIEWGVVKINDWKKQIDWEQEFSDISDGYYKYKYVRESDGKTVDAKINLLTGDTEIKESDPNLVSVDLISLN